MRRIVVPFAGVEGKTRLHASPLERHELSLAMLGDVLDACVAVGPTTVVTGDPDARTLALGAGARRRERPGRRPGRCGARGARRARARSGARRQRRSAVRRARRRARSRHARAGRQDSRSSRPRTGRRTRSACLSQTRSRRSTGPAAPRAFVHMRRSRGSSRCPSRFRISPTTSTRSRICTGSPCAVAPARRRASPSSGSRRCGESRGPVGRRRRLSLRTRPRGGRRSGAGHGRRQRGRRRRGARTPRLSGSRLGPLRARRAERRGARLGPRRRDVAGARDRARRSAASRGSASATSTSDCISYARRHSVVASRCPR